MKTLTLKLENCYGIRKLDEKLDFSTAKAIAIYAPNGSMKTLLKPLSCVRLISNLRLKPASSKAISGLNN